MGEDTEGIPEGRAEFVEGGHFLPGERLRQPVAEGVAERESGLSQIDAGTADPIAERHLLGALGRERGIEVQQAVAVDAAVGVDAPVVGGRQKAGDQRRVGELVAVVVLHHHQRARRHRRGKGGSAGGVGAARTRRAVDRVGPVVGRADGLAGGRNAPLCGDAATVGEGGDPAIAPDRHDGDHVPAQLGYPGRQARVDIGRSGVDLVSRHPQAVDKGHAEVRMAGEVGGIAGIAVAVACGKDEDGLVADARLRQRGNRVAEVVAKLLLAVLLDDPGEAHAHVDEVDGAARPADDAVDEGRPPAVVVTEGRQRDRNIVAAAASGCDGEHRDVGAPGDAAPGAGCGSVRIARPPHDHRRLRSPQPVLRPPTAARAFRARASVDASDPPRRPVLRPPPATHRAKRTHDGPYEQHTRDVGTYRSYRYADKSYPHVTGRWRVHARPGRANPGGPRYKGAEGRTALAHRGRNRGGEA